MERDEEDPKRKINSSNAEDEEYFIYSSIFQEKEVDDERIKELEEKIFSFMKAISEDTRQLSEFMMEEGNIVKDVCAYLIKILSQLDLSVVLPEKIVPAIKSCEKIILNSQGHLIIIKEKGEVESKSLEKYPPEIILMVILGVIPRLKEAVNTYMKKISVRINFFEKINEELGSIQKNFEFSLGESLKDSEDLREKRVREALIYKK